MKQIEANINIKENAIKRAIVTLIESIWLFSWYWDRVI